MNFTNKIRLHLILEIALILVIASLAYFPNLAEASIYRDDWYYALDRMIGGPGAFQEMFSIDRPARGPLFEAYYLLFGVKPWPYHFSSFIWRLMGGLTALGLFKLIWPSKRQAALFMATLFMLFPGYSRLLEGFENQPRILSSFLEVLSIFLTLQALKTREIPKKAIFWIASILTGWAYIALVDFSFGMEFFRLLCVYLYVSQVNPSLTLGRKIMPTLQSWAIAALVPLGFLFWRLFIFNNERPTTDIGLQLSFLTDSPLHTGLTWAIRLFQSTINVAVLAWTMPPSQGLFNYDLSEILIGLLLAGSAAFVTIFVYLSIDRIQHDTRDDSAAYPSPWQFQTIIIGLVGVIAGVIPVVMANRFATLGNYSHYALPASLASAAMVGALVFSITSRKIRLAAMAVLVLFGVISHYVVSSRITHEETIISNFWKQVVWRAPGIRAGTTLFVNYPSVDYGQDVDTVAGPANFLYFPENMNKLPAIYPISALEQGDYTTKDILSNPGKAYTFRYRTHKSEVDYSNLLIITQPTEDSCVHVLDSNWQRSSIHDPYSITLVGGQSKIGNVVTDIDAPIPDADIFGADLPQSWCYYYQKAELALQQEDWQQIVILGNEALRQELAPVDAIEWLPFIQAYALSGNESILSQLAKSIKQEPYYKLQACQTFTSMASGSYKLTPDVTAEVNRLFCSK